MAASRRAAYHIHISCIATAHGALSSWHPRNITSPHNNHGPHLREMCLAIVAARIALHQHQYKRRQQTSRCSTSTAPRRACMRIKSGCRGGMCRATRSGCLCVKLSLFMTLALIIKKKKNKSYLRAATYAENCTPAYAPSYRLGALRTVHTPKFVKSTACLPAWRLFWPLPTGVVWPYLPGASQRKQAWTC